MSRSRDTADWGQYQPVRKNAVINGNFNIWQRNVTFADPLNGQYVADRMQALRTGIGFFDVDQTIDHPLIAGGSCFEATVATADTSLLTTDSYGFQTKIEGYDYQRLDQNACTLSFWVKSNVTGTYYGSFTNEGGPPSHSYVYSYTVNVANTWEKKSVTFTPGTIGTFNMTNGEGLRIRWSFGDGATNQTGTLDAWQAGNYRAGTSGVNFMGTVSNSFRIADIQLELGEEATDFEYRHFADELVLCQRYYEKSYSFDDYPGDVAQTGMEWNYHAGGMTSASHIAGQGARFKVVKRTDPTVTTYSPVTGASGKARDFIATIADVNSVLADIGDEGFRWYATSNGAKTQYSFAIQWEAEAEF